MRAEESKTYSVFELTSRLFAAFFYQFLRPEDSFRTKLGKVFLGFSESLCPSLQHELFLVQTRYQFGPRLKFQLHADFGGKQKPSRIVHFDRECFHVSIIANLADQHKYAIFLSNGRSVLDPQLLALLVQMAPFQAECLGRVGHLVVMLLELGDNDVAFVRVHSF
jgi:hypothetical protein